MSYNKKYRYENPDSIPMGTMVKKVSITPTSISFTTKRNKFLVIFFFCLFIIPGIIYVCTFKTKEINLDKEQIIQCIYDYSDKSYYLNAEKGEYRIEKNELTRDIIKWLKYFCEEFSDNKKVINMNVKNYVKEDRLKTKERIIDLKQMHDAKIINKSQFDSMVKEAGKNIVEKDKKIEK